MNRNHLAFDPEAFLMSFSAREEILDAYLDTLPARALTLNRPIQSWEALNAHLRACSPEEFRIVASGFREAFELCSDEGHERLIQVCSLTGKSTPELLALPAECLSLKVLTEDRDIFESALSLDQVMSSDSLELFKPQATVALTSDIKRGVAHFRSEIALLCGSKYGSQRVLLKHFVTPDTLTVGFYFEKRPKAQRLLDGAAASPRLRHEEFRPIQLDFIIFERSTGVLSVRSAWGRLTDEIRRAFATAFLDNPAAYDWPGARDILDLHLLMDLNDETVAGAGAVVTEVHYNFPNDALETRYRISSSNVRESLRRDDQAGRLARARIQKTVVQVPVPSTARKRRVVLQAPNKVEFRRTSGTIEIVRQLRDWHVFNAPINSQAAA